MAFKNLFGSLMNFKKSEDVNHRHPNTFFEQQQGDIQRSIKVLVPEGSLCSLRVTFPVGLPPEAVYDIITDPGNKRVFKNVKEVVSRKVLLDEGERQLVELEQAAIWKFLWWSGTFSVYVLVDQSRKDFSMKFRQMKSGVMKRFEGSWKIEPLYVDESVCLPLKPSSIEDYQLCSEGRGRVGSMVTLDQLIQPSVVPPPPISWYLRGITSKTTEMIVTDLLAETAKIRDGKTFCDNQGFEFVDKVETIDIKRRWRVKRRRRKMDIL